MAGDEVLQIVLGVKQAGSHLDRAVAAHQVDRVASHRALLHDWRRAMGLDAGQDRPQCKLPDPNRSWRVRSVGEFPWVRGGDGPLVTCG